MRILLDESVPAPLGALLAEHRCTTVQKRGWAGVKNGALLALAAQEFDVLLTADRGMEYQQNLQTLAVAVLVLQAPSNRMRDVELLLPAIRAALVHLKPRTLRKIGPHDSHDPSP